MKRLSAGLIVAILVIIAIVAAVAHKSSTPASNSNSQSSSSSQNSSDNTRAAGTVDIRNMMFTPSQITVQKGQSVTWTNNDSMTHTVVDDLSNVGGPASGDIAPGQSYTFTFNKTGSFQYHCSIHPSMRGTIVVK